LTDLSEQAAVPDLSFTKLDCIIDVMAYFSLKSKFKELLKAEILERIVVSANKA